MDAPEILALIILGILAGSTAAWATSGLTKKRGKNGWLNNAVIGVLGALVGGFIFSALDIEMPDILSGTIQVADMLVAFIGACIVIIVMQYVNK
jgi:uncharacterized membrane protein YeaQ/YmgE (transglycosylase-associated protein family)